MTRELPDPAGRGAGRTADGEGAGTLATGGVAPLPDPDLDMELNEINSFLEKVETDLCRPDADAAR